jgi:hypothetical protein
MKSLPPHTAPEKEEVIRVGDIAISTTTGERVEILEIFDNHIGRMAKIRYLDNSRTSYSGWSDEATSPIEFLGVLYE